MKYHITKNDISCIRKTLRKTLLGFSVSCTSDSKKQKLKITVKTKTNINIECSILGVYNFEEKFNINKQLILYNNQKIEDLPEIQCLITNIGDIMQKTQLESRSQGYDTTTKNFFYVNQFLTELHIL